MKIPFNYLPFQFFNTSPYFKEWKKLIKSSEFTLGSYVENFEKEFHTSSLFVFTFESTAEISQISNDQLSRARIV